VIKLLRVPFTYSGYVDIECTEEEYEDVDREILHDRALDELDCSYSLDYMDFQGFCFSSAEWVDAE
jgi:hypothetical protein